MGRANPGPLSTTHKRVRALRQVSAFDGRSHEKSRRDFVHEEMATTLQTLQIQAHLESRSDTLGVVGRWLLRAQISSSILHYLLE